MNEQAIGDPRGFDRKREAKREFRSYIWGLSLALAMTLVPFGLVQWSTTLPRFWLLIVIGMFAVAQIVVHFRFFLLIDLSQQKREDLQLILFSTLILLLMGGGTIWIMTNLALRMRGIFY
jgi:cytochrome o ubiquinol oxidase operon protein cyoD